MCGEPARCFGDKHQDDQHGNDTEALEDDWDSPGVAAQVAGKRVVNPVYQSNAKVQS